MQGRDKGTKEQRVRRRYVFPCSPWMMGLELIVTLTWREQYDPSMWSSLPKFQQSPSLPKYSTWLPSPSWFSYVLSRFILKYMWPTQFQRTMFSLIIPWVMFRTRREQALETISKSQDDSRKDLDRQQWGCQRVDGWHLVQGEQQNLRPAGLFLLLSLHYYQS